MLMFKALMRMSYVCQTIMSNTVKRAVSLNEKSIVSTPSVGCTMPAHVQQYLLTPIKLIFHLNLVSFKFKERKEE